MWDDPSGGHAHQQAAASPPPPAPTVLDPDNAAAIEDADPESWVECVDDEGTPYFYNARVGVSTWRIPARKAHGAPNSASRPALTSDLFSPGSDDCTDAVATDAAAPDPGPIDSSDQNGHTATRGESGSSSSTAAPAASAATGGEATDSTSLDDSDSDDLPQVTAEMARRLSKPRHSFVAGKGHARGNSELLEFPELDGKGFPVRLSLTALHSNPTHLHVYAPGVPRTPSAGNDMKPAVSQTGSCLLYTSPSPRD